MSSRHPNTKKVKAKKVTKSQREEKKDGNRAILRQPTSPKGEKRVIFER